MSYPIPPHLIDIDKYEENPMEKKMSHPDKRLYNYIVNTFGLTKEVVLNYAQTRIEDLLSKHITAKLDSKYVEKIILDRISRIMDEGLKDSPSYFKSTSFDDYVKKTIKRVIEEKMDEEYNVEMRVTLKGNTVVHRS